MTEDSRMVRIHHHHPLAKQEERPYRECPHCHEYAFRTVRREKLTYDGFWDWLSIFGGEWEVDYEYEKCKNCQYKES